VVGAIVIGAGGLGVQFNRSNAYTYAGVISGNGFVNKNAGNTLTLTGANTYTGSTSVNGGTLKVGAVNALPTTTSVSVSSGATLDVAANQTITKFGNSFSNSSIIVEASQILNVTLGNSVTGTGFNGVISGAGGFQVGTNFGAHTVTLFSDNTYTGGTTIDSGGALRLGGDSANGMIVGNVVNNGTLIFQRTSGAFFNGVISGTGMVQQGTTTGTAELGDIKLTAANTYTGGTQVYRGSLFALNTTGSATGTGTVTVQGNGFLGGNGKIGGPLHVSLGGSVAGFTAAGWPATLSVGATTFGGGGRLGFGIADATGVAGTDFSLLSISGALSISADSTSPFVVEMYSFSAPDTIGAALNFDPALAQSWTFATASGGITGFNAAAFAVDSTFFAGPNVGANISPGAFTVGMSGNSLLLQYSPTAVPEPSTWALLASGLALVAFSTVRRHRSRRAR
jgi:autotransporter-associated beta strand protein